MHMLRYKPVTDVRMHVYYEYLSFISSPIDHLENNLYS